MTDKTGPNSEHSEPTKQKPEEWELELVIGDPEYSTVGMIAIFHKRGERVWMPLPPPEPKE